MIKQLLSECHFSQNIIQSMWTYPTKQKYTSHAMKVCNIIDTTRNYIIYTYF